MPVAATQQMVIGVDVGGTFTDLVAWDGQNLLVLKTPSTPPKFHEAIADVVRQVAGSAERTMIHGSTVATNALLQRRGEPIAFITTEGFRDMLLIGRQNRPKLYALRVERPPPIASSENCFTVRERIDAAGNVVEPLSRDEIDRVVREVLSNHLTHAAVCLLFSYVNPSHERLLGESLESAGITTSLSSDVVPEFREYERASTTALNAFLRPTVQSYLQQLRDTVESNDLRIMHSGGGTLDTDQATRNAVRLVLSGPAGGVIGAAFVAKLAGLENVITYDMGGTSTDVSTVIEGAPQWTTQTTIDGLPIALPMFDINTIGAGGGSIAYLDAGGALKVGPQSAGAVPGPVCYGRGGESPTVTDANVVLGRISAAHFLGGAMRLDIDAANRAVDVLAAQIGKSRTEAALGIVRIVEANMAQAVRAVTSRRGRDPRDFTLVSFGGAGGLHACGLAEALEIRQILVPSYCGVLSALGMIVAPPMNDVSQTVLHITSESFNDAKLRTVLDDLCERAGRRDDRAEYFADVRFVGQSHEVTVPFEVVTVVHIHDRFREAYQALYGQLPQRDVQIVSLRLRRTGKPHQIALPPLESGKVVKFEQEVIDEAGKTVRATAVSRRTLQEPGTHGRPLLIIDDEATTFVPADWFAEVLAGGAVLLRRRD